MTNSMMTRRQLLSTSGALVASSFIPRISNAAGRDPRLLTVVLRGGLDAMAVAAPIGDPDYVDMRQELAFGGSGKRAGIRLDDFFALNSNMPALAKLYGNGEALFVHAVATPYRSRSHFDGQDILESGYSVAGVADSGWMNRALDLAETKGRVDNRGFAVGAQVPLIMRGPASVMSWMPPGFRAANDDTRDRLLDIYRHVDPELAAAVESGIELDDMIGGEAQIRQVMSESTKMGGRGKARTFRMLGSVAGRVMADPDGPRLGSFDLGGWDTHAKEKLFDGPFGRQLGALDATIDGLRRHLADVWSDTVIVLATEFGRTVRMNGTHGTDHGTGTLVILIGGAVRGGRVIADWPGVSERALYEGRDLRPTMDMRAVFKGILRDHLDIPERKLGNKVFPESESVKPLNGLIA